MGWRLAIFGFLATVVAAASLGIAAGSSERKPWDALVVSADQDPPILRCEDAPTLPPEREVSAGWGSDENSALLGLLWAEGSGADERFIEFSVRVDDPSCPKRPDIQKYLDVDITPPRFENAHILLQPGQERAYVGYTIIDHVGQLTTFPGDITATRADGRSIKWKHQTATGGPADIGVKGRRVVTATDDLGPYRHFGDADYFDSAGLQVGETVTVTFPFFATQDLMYDGPSPPTPRAIVKVPFLIVAPD